jgi:hypothetical protein
MAMGEIHGVVYGQGGRPLSDAVIMIVGDSPSHRDLALLTNHDGTFLFDDLRAGDYELLINAEGYAPHRHAVKVWAGGRSPAEIWLE